jgi:chromosome segregation ATPase
VQKHTLEIKVKELECMVDSLTNRLQDKDVNSKDTHLLISSKDAEIGSLNKRVVSLEAENTRMQRTIDELNKKCDDRQHETKKINDDYEHVKLKNETMQKVIYKQEESIKDLETNLKEYKNKIENKSSELSIFQDKLHAKDIEITAIKDKLADADKLLENNKQMIAWLNTQVSEHKFNKFKPPTSVPNFNMNNNYSNAQSF